MSVRLAVEISGPLSARRITPFLAEDGDKATEKARAGAGTQGSLPGKGVTVYNEGGMGCDDARPVPGPGGCGRPGPFSATLPPIR
jgi:hypothetical protein